MASGERYATPRQQESEACLETRRQVPDRACGVYFSPSSAPQEPGFKLARPAPPLRSAPLYPLSSIGAQVATRTLMRLFPDRGTAVVLMSNCEYANLQPIALAMERVLFE